MIPSSNKNRKPTNSKKSGAMISGMVLMIAFFVIGALYAVETGLDATSHQTTLREKIDAYKKFKEKYEDKDFQLNSYPVRRVEHVNGKLRTSAFNVYHIGYGMIADNKKEYGKSRKQVVKHPTNLQMGRPPVCRSGLYLEDYNESGLYPEISCIEDADLSYPLSLILNTISKEDLNEIAIIYEFNDGDLDIQFPIDRGSDKDLVESLFNKLTEADEKNDQKRQEVKMEPIMPTKNQRLTAAFIDEDKDGEKDFVLIPYCINGSFFDEDPANNTIQVALKYKLVTRKDLAASALQDKKLLEEQLGLWMWDKPCEILTSFSDNPGPDIVFYDLGKVVNRQVVDARPDGKFDKYEFLY